MAEKGLLIMVGIVDSEKSRDDNKDFLDNLQSIGLEEERHYCVLTLPPSLEDYPHAPIIEVRKKNLLGLPPKIFCGETGRELFLNQARLAQAKAQGATQNG